MQLPKRHYDIQERHLQLALAEDLDLLAEKQCIYLHGANGYGKSTFLEKVLLPQLDANAVPFVYVGQDLRTQLYCLRALLAVQGHKVGMLSEQALIRLWIDKISPVQILILDEFDKYFSAYQFIFDATQAFVQTYVIVTHSGRDLMIPELRTFKISRLQFELQATHQQDKHIRIVPRHGHF